ncbi:MAG TPA: L,D-transpeptidase family protein [Syntrophales bacterium]
MNVRPLHALKRTAPALLAAWVFLFVFSSPVTATGLTPVTDAVVDRVIIEKSKRTMTLLKQDREVRTYKIALGRDPVGPKVMQGDNKTPEGIYYVDYKVPNSVYHRALHLSYPSPEDVERAKALGVPPGGSIMIHGMKPDKLWMGDVQYLFNWTSGCIALTNREIEEVWVLVPSWTPVEIRP